MSLPAILDVAIGLVVVFFLMATIASMLVELWAGWRKHRHSLLRAAINDLLGSGAQERFWNHPLIEPLCNRKGSVAQRAPAYLDETVFAEVVFDLAVGAAPDVRTNREAMERAFADHLAGESKLSLQLHSLLRRVDAGAPDFVAAMRTAIAAWFKEAMQRTSGVYRRDNLRRSAIVAVVLAVLLNCDAVRIADVLYQNPTLRAQVAAQAQALSATGAKPDSEPDRTDPDPNALRAELKSSVASLAALTKVGFPLGWTSPFASNFISPDEPFAAGLAKLAGLAASILAILLGAPFWFDLLGKLVKLRTSAGSEAEQKKDSKDKSPGATATPAAATPATTSGAPAAVAAATSSAPNAGAPPSPPRPLLETLRDSRTEYVPDRALRLAEAADKVYEPLDKLSAWLVNAGFDAAQIETIDVGSTQGALAIRDHTALLVFRGTQPDKLEDLLADANVKRVSAQDAQVARDAKDGKGAKSSIAALAVPGRMHAGFAAALGLVVAKLDAAAPKLAGCTLHVAGHSLGGALATLAAIHLSRRHSCPIGSVYTFGSPRVGDGVFAREFELRLGTRCHRVVNNEDLVTRVPTRTMGYEHVGRIAYIDGDGCVSHDIGQWFRVLSFVTNALGDFKETVKTTVRDHSMKLYVGHLERAAKRP